MKNGEITVRFAAENELARVNELREQVSRLHAETDRMFFARISVMNCGRLQKTHSMRMIRMLLLPAWTETYADLQYRSTLSGRNHAVGAPKSFAGFPNSALMQL